MNEPPVREVFGDSVVVELPADEQETAFGLVIPGTVSHEYPDTGTVVLLPKHRNPKLPFPADHLKVGDKVIFDRHAGDLVATKGEGGKPGIRFRILLLDSIYAKVS